MPFELPEHLRDHPLIRHTYRPNVAMIVRNDAGLLLWCERADLSGIWQFPQGGVDPGEEHEQAMWRELGEELGMPDARAHMALEARLSEPLRYHFPIEVIERWVRSGRASGVGQAQYFYLLRFFGDESAITLDPPDGGHREFQSYTWADASQLEHAPYFKKRVMREALTGFDLMR